MKYLKSYFANFTNASGRTSTMDFWMTMLWIMVFNMLVSVIVGLIGSVLYIPTLGGIVLAGLAVVMMFATISLQIRRLHDSNKPGTYILFNLIPIIGQILLIVYYCAPSTPGVNNYGEPTRL